jgi:hypothetical protein
METERRQFFKHASRKLFHYCKLSMSRNVLKFLVQLHGIEHVTTSVVIKFESNKLGRDYLHGR